MSEKFERGPARAAPAYFPYDHPTLAEVDAKAAERKKRSAYALECKRVRRQVFG